MLSAFLFGLLSSLHCIGMCGPIAMMLPVHRSNQSVKAVQILLYHSGRILTYSLFGFVFGVLGKGLFIAGLQQRLSIIIGVAMIVYILLPKRMFTEVSFLQPLYALIARIKAKMGTQLREKKKRTFFTIGFFNGFLPCAMVYVALFGATATQSPVTGAFYMALFGLGTVPMMSLVVYFSNAVSLSLRNRLLQYIPIFVVVLGMLFVIRGLGLSIPFLSPGTLQLFVSSNPNC
ncbi:sulfite exporter TauE/SafE family protein [Paenimyroides ceti]